MRLPLAVARRGGVLLAALLRNPAADQHPPDPRPESIHFSGRRARSLGKNDQRVAPPHQDQLAQFLQVAEAAHGAQQVTALAGFDFAPGDVTVAFGDLRALTPGATGGRGDGREMATFLDPSFEEGMVILDVAEQFRGLNTRAVKKVPLLRGRTVINLFFEPSTRTRTTFELAAKRLSADVLNINISTSATSKGETLLDTLQNIQAMHCDMFVVRHSDSGAAHYIANNVAPNISIINAGDGSHEHPTQALLDAYTIRQRKGPLKGLRVAIIERDGSGVPSGTVREAALGVVKGFMPRPTPEMFLETIDVVQDIFNSDLPAM